MSYRLITFVLVIFCLLPIATLGQTAATAQNSPAPLGKLIDVGGYRVHLYCIGAGSPPSSSWAQGTPSTGGSCNPKWQNLLRFAPMTTPESDGAIPARKIRAHLGSARYTPH